MRTSSAISLEHSERQFASLLSGQLDFIIERCSPVNLRKCLTEINDFLDVAIHLELSPVRSARIFTPEEINQLVAVLSPYCGQGYKETIRAILKEAFKSHKIPNDL